MAKFIEKIVLSLWKIKNMKNSGLIRKRQAIGEMYMFIRNGNIVWWTENGHKIDNERWNSGNYFSTMSTRGAIENYIKSKEWK